MTSQNALGEKLLTPQELADYLRVPRSTLNYWRRTGKGPRALLIGRSLRYDPTDVRAWRDSTDSDAS